ncbi:MAG TPA: RES family NAD+ phosphorylase [Gammaproteobacteria bacterium]
MPWDTLLKTVTPQSVAGTLLRLVESQEQVATNQLVSSLQHQALLEEMLEATKPPRRKGTEHLHYLLATPFRYPPLRHGSRFGTRHEPSLFYGSQQARTVLAEAAYYRFVFWHGMATPPGHKLDTQHTLFTARYSSAQGLRLQDEPFSAYAAQLTHPADYRATQALGATMRAHGIEAFEFTSARDPEQGINIALFSPRALAAPAPLAQEPWLCELSAGHVRFHAAHTKAFFDFPLAVFQRDGRFPQPA